MVKPIAGSVTVHSSAGNSSLVATESHNNLTLTQLFDSRVFRIEHLGGFFERRSIRFTRTAQMEQELALTLDGEDLGTFKQTRTVQVTRKEEVTQELTVKLDKIAKIFNTLHGTGFLSKETEKKVAKEIHKGYSRNFSVYDLVKSDDRKKFEAIYRQIFVGATQRSSIDLKGSSVGKASRTFTKAMTNPSVSLHNAMRRARSSQRRQNERSHQLAQAEDEQIRRQKDEKVGA